MPHGFARRWLTALTVGVSLASPLAVPAHGSTVLTVLLSDEIVMAGDSRGQYSLGREVGGQTDDECKVFVVGRFLFGFTGMAGDATPHFNPRKRVVQILRKHPTSIDEAADAVADQLYDDFLFALDRLRRENRQAYAKRASKPIVASVVLATLDEGRPKVKTIDFLVRASKPPVPASYSTRGIVTSGERDAIQGDVDDLMKRGPLKSEDAVAQVTALIAKQAQHDPAVGGEVDVVRLTKNGPSWLAIKPGCNQQE
jgi:20S proteasome alpha/beta subunit